MTSHEALNRYWYVRLPQSLVSLVPRVADAIGDGGWAVAWTRVAAWAPVIVFGVGLFVPRTWPGMQVVYTESPVFLALAVALGILSGTSGVALVVANGIREALSHDMASSVAAVLHVGAGQLVVWLLLGVLVVVLPQLALLLAEAVIVRMRFLRHRDVRAVCRSLLLAVVYAGLVLMWCQAAPVLVRPVFIWAGTSPSAEAVATVGAWWPWIAATAAGAAFVRGILEGTVIPRMRLAANVTALSQERQVSAPEAGSAWAVVPEALRTAVAVAGTTLLMAGLFERLADSLAAGLVIGALVMLARGVGGWLMGFWGLRMRQTHGALRIAAAIGGGCLLTSGVLALELGGTPLRSMMIGALLTLALLVLMFPALILRPRRPPVQKAWS